MNATTREARPIFLQNIPEDVVRRLDELYGLVRSGSVTLHKNDGETVKFEHRVIESARSK